MAVELMLAILYTVFSELFLFIAAAFAALYIGLQFAAAVLEALGRKGGQ